MDDRARKQIQQIADHAVRSVRTELHEKLERVFSDLSERGMLRSNMTIRASLRTMDSVLSVFINDLSSNLLAVSTGSEAGETLSDAIAAAIQTCDTLFRRAARHSGIVRDAESASNDAAQASYRGMLETIELKLNIARFNFGEKRDRRSSNPNAATGIVPKKGGRPPAAFWDDMWSAIAASLYEGTLVPKSQSDIENAMSEWIEGAGHSAAPSTVRARARRLWDRLLRLEE